LPGRQGFGVRLLDLATYPVARPFSGGQLRRRAIARAYRAAGIATRLCAVYDCHQHGGDDIDRWDLPFDARRSSHRAELAPADDLRAGLFAAEDDATFRQIAAIADRFAPDAIQLEHPWCWPAVERLLARSSRPRPRIIYSAHNVEGPLRRQMLADVPGAEPVCRLVEIIEAAAVHDADLVLAVTSADAEAFRSMGARHVHVYVNGVDRRPVMPAAQADWRARLGSEPMALFVASGHPPNALGFMDLLGPALGFLPPDRKIVVVGSVAGTLMATDGFQPWEGINRSRIHFTGPLAEVDLAALLALAQVIILPITAGGGSNVKTAEALHAGRYVVGTSLAFRGFERFLELPGVYRYDDPADFRRRLVEQLEAPPPVGGNEALRRELLWSATLRGLPDLVRQLAGGRPLPRPLHPSTSSG
jgi:glycosyltransferase involved in cell wall biosynthesis